MNKVLKFQLTDQNCFHKKDVALYYFMPCSTHIIPLQLIYGYKLFSIVKIRTHSSGLFGNLQNNYPHIRCIPKILNMKRYYVIKHLTYFIINKYNKYFSYDIERI